MRFFALATTAALVGFFLLAMAPPASAAPVCTGYMNVLGSKQRSCVDPTQAPSCGAWSEGWSQWLGYWKSCYGTAALCNPSGCIDYTGCFENLCLV